MRRFFLGMLVLVTLASFGARAQTPKKIPVLVFSGQNNHNWRLTTPHLRSILEQTGRFDCRVVEDLTAVGPELLARYDLILSDYNGGRIGERFEKALTDFVAGGKGLVIVHAANNAFNGWDEYDRMIGAAWRAGTYHPAFGKYEVTIVNRAHPITAGLKSFETTDEMYCNMRAHPEARTTLLATSIAPSGAVQGKPQPMALVVEYGKGRVFHTPLGHVGNEAQLISQRGLGFQTLLLRGAEWAATGQVTFPVPEALKEP